MCLWGFTSGVTRQLLVAYLSMSSRKFNFKIGEGI